MNNLNRVESTVSVRHKSYHFATECGMQIVGKKGLVNPTNGLLINTLYDVLNQHMPLLGIVRVTM